jgi:ABC-type multidrug transport system fused ATPase/permease subunit
VIEDGTHKSLMANPDGEYAKMYEKQKQWYE